jgi:hypothetical protein
MGMVGGTRGRGRQTQFYLSNILRPGGAFFRAGQKKFTDLISWFTRAFPGECSACLVRDGVEPHHSDVVGRKVRVAVGACVLRDAERLLGEREELVLDVALEPI